MAADQVNFRAWLQVAPLGSRCPAAPIRASSVFQIRTCVLYHVRMSWLDDFGLVAGALGATPAKPTRPYTTRKAKLRSAGFQTDYGASSKINWSDLGSGSLGSGISRPFAVSGGQPTLPGPNALAPGFAMDTR